MTRRKDYRVPDMLCLACGHHLTAASVTEGRSRKPRPGDLTLCIGCAHLMIFTDDLRLRNLTPDEARQALTELNVIRARLAILMTKATTNRDTRDD